MWRNRSPRPEPVRVFVGHADAGLRSAWRGADEWRGLTDVGHQQARAVAGMLADLTVLRILSGPSLRCRQTVLPLSLARTLDVESCWQLGPVVRTQYALDLIADPDTASSVICAHRETLQAISERLAGPYRTATAPGSDPVGRDPVDRDPVDSDPVDSAAVWVLRGALSGAQPPRWEYLGSGAALVA